MFVQLEYTVCTPALSYLLVYMTHLFFACFLLAVHQCAYPSLTEPRPGRTFQEEGQERIRLRWTNPTLFGKSRSCFLCGENINLQVHL